MVVSLRARATSSRLSGGRRLRSTPGIAWAADRDGAVDTLSRLSVGAIGMILWVLGYSVAYFLFFVKVFVSKNHLFF